MHPQGYATFDRTHFPFIKITITGTSATEENFKAYLSDLSKNYAEKERIKILFDASKATFPGFKFQKMQSDWIKENEHLMKNYCAGTAYVIPNAIIRTALNLIFKLQPQPVPYKVVSNQDDANIWLQQLS
ncbi:MAG: STAS/SEC14 domain-containing protein [Bacteroidota bacterium]